MFYHLGAATAEAKDIQNLSLAGQMLHNLRNKLLEVDAVIRRSPAAARAVGRDLSQAWERHRFLVSNYQRFRVLFGFSEEPGLSGLGELIVGGLTLAGVIAAVSLLLLTTGFLLSKALAAERNEAALSTAVARQATGTTAGTQFRPVITPSGQVVVVPQPGPESFGQWLEDNWIWLALAAAGLIVVPRLLK